MIRTDALSRLRKLETAAVVVSAALFVKVLISILLEYRWYFPADFDAAFLVGRQESFAGAYRAAFYTHIISGPLAVVLGAFLVLSGGRQHYRSVHRRVARVQVAVVLLAVVPSGLVMAPQTHAGMFAAVGFSSLALATAACAAAAVHFVRSGRLFDHQKWAGRCFVLLCSPLLLRLIGGAATVMEAESIWIYRFNAWLSWLIPLLIYEVWWHRSHASRRSGDSVASFTLAAR